MRLETERLLLRPMQLDDVDDLVAFSSRPEVTRYMSSLNREQALQRLQSDQIEWAERGCGMVAIVELRTGRLVGRTGFKYWPQFGETEVGWALDPDVWGRGLATEAARACVSWGLENRDVPYLTAMIRPDNARSIRVANRLGMTPLRDDVLLGEPVIVYAVSRESAQR